MAKHFCNGQHDPDFNWSSLQWKFSLARTTMDKNNHGLSWITAFGDPLNRRFFIGHMAEAFDGLRISAVSHRTGITASNVVPT